MRVRSVPLRFRRRRAAEHDNDAGSGSPLRSDGSGKRPPIVPHAVLLLGVAATLRPDTRQFLLWWTSTGRVARSRADARFVHAKQSLTLALRLHARRLHRPDRLAVRGRRRRRRRPAARDHLVATQRPVIGLRALRSVRARSLLVGKTDRSGRRCTRANAGAISAVEPREAYATSTLMRRGCRRRPSAPSVRRRRHVAGNYRPRPDGCGRRVNESPQLRSLLARRTTSEAPPPMCWDRTCLSIRALLHSGRFGGGRAFKWRRVGSRSSQPTRLHAACDQRGRSVDRLTHRREQSLGEPRGGQHDRPTGLAPKQPRP
jgi:hypothetical protein